MRLYENYAPSHRQIFMTLCLMKWPPVLTTPDWQVFSLPAPMTVFRCPFGFIVEKMPGLSLNIKTKFPEWTVFLRSGFAEDGGGFAVNTG